MPIHMSLRMSVHMSIHMSIHISIHSYPSAPLIGFATPFPVPSSGWATQFPTFRFGAAEAAYTFVAGQWGACSVGNDCTGALFFWTSRSVPTADAEGGCGRV